MAVDPGWKRWARIGALIVLLFGSYVVAEITGVSDQLSREWIQQRMESAGPWGLVLFVGIFAVGELVHVPGLIFVAAAILAYGELWGGLAGYLGALVSVAVSFLVVRGVGGQPLADVERPFLKRWLGRLERQPVRVVALLRLVLWMAPPLNYALAMSGVRFRHYLVGSALGLAPPIALVAVFFDWIFARLL